MSIRLAFEPSGIAASALVGETVLEAARRAGVRIGSACGGRGRCRACGVRLEGIVAPANAADRDVFSAAELAAGWRRACQTRVAGAASIHVPARSAAAALTRGQEAGASRIPMAEPVAPSGLGLAVDLGTTNLAAALIDLGSGQVLASGAAENPQGIFGADVISRGGRALRVPDAPAELQRLAVGAIAELARTLTDNQPQRISQVAVVGNSVMSHLLLGLSVETLVKVPYQPAVTDAQDGAAAMVGLHLAPGAQLHVGPNIAGFVGSDHVAALLEVLENPPQGRWALLDIGTNTEISLFDGQGLTSASCPSGPAFEGGVLSCGMRAATGAIERAAITAQGLELHTIDGAPAVGLCGSGVLSLLAALRGHGLVDAKGRLGLDHPAVRQTGDDRALVLAHEDETGGLALLFSQADIRAVQLAKAAIRAGLDLLLESAGLAPEDLDHLIVAGAFGKYIDLNDAMAIGMLPRLPAQRLTQVGNAAGAGARRMLACRAARRQATQLARQARYLELASRPDFQKRFIQAMGL
jgi:uncharacterized 2Fe-2S/4Fe-4S cluster protein (DUF4445 family)